MRLLATSTGLSESLTRSIKCRITVFPFKTISYTVFDGSWDTGNAIKAKNLIMFAM